ncbi:hypothetical protein HN51_063630 [Arachis hypogaea]
MAVSSRPFFLSRLTDLSLHNPFIPMVLANAAKVTNRSSNMKQILSVLIVIYHPPENRDLRAKAGTEMNWSGLHIKLQQQECVIQLTSVSLHQLVCIQPASA